MEKYLIYFNENQTNKNFISTIYRNSTSDTADMGDAIEFIDKETALAVANYLNERKSVSKYKVLCVKTTIEEVK